MKYVISFYLWTTGFIYFGLFCLFAVILILFVPNEKLDPIIKKGCRGLFKLLRIRVEVSGTEHLNSEKTYLFLANHVSLLDMPLYAGFIPGFVRVVEAKHHFKWPVYGWLTGRLGNIPIDRKNVHASIRSMGETNEWLKQDRSIIILPEGHRTLDGKLRSFKRLPFHLAQKAGVDIIPVGMSGMYNLNRKGTFLINPTTLKVKFGKPIPQEKSAGLPVDELQNLTRKRIQDLIEYP